MGRVKDDCAGGGRGVGLDLKAGGFALGHVATARKFRAGCDTGFQLDWIWGRGGAGGHFFDGQMRPGPSRWSVKYLALR